MLSGQVIQETLDGIRSITHASVMVYDMRGRLLNQAGSMPEADEGLIAAFCASDAIEQASGAYLLYKVFDEREPEYIIISFAPETNAHMTLRLVAFQLESLNVAYKERYDRENFIKNLLLDNLLVVDIYNRARKLHIDINAERVVFLVETREEETGALDILRELFEMSELDFVTAIDEHDFVLVKHCPGGRRELEELADSIGRELSERGIEARVAYGNPVKDIKEVSKSYKEARLALDVAGIFYEDKQVIAYSNLGIGRLIYQLPVNLCRMFITEIFHGRTPNDLDEETLTTIDKFFENSLNVSETSRQLFIHRNTLVYRLDKLQRATGLDLRVFDDAITFKIALMVLKYMDHIENNDYS